MKVLPAYWSRDPERLQRFELEAQAAAALNHSNIVSIYSVGQYDGAPYIVTELDPQTRAIFARNLWTGEFGGRIAFADLRGASGQQLVDTGDFHQAKAAGAHVVNAFEVAQRRDLDGRVGRGFENRGALVRADLFTVDR